MSVIKLPNAGDEATFQVVKCEVVESQNVKNADGTPSEQVKFTAMNGDTLFIGREPADRALARIGFADGEQVFYGDVDGWTLRFYRVQNKNKAFKPYWNIDKVSGDTAPATPQVAKAQPSQATPATQATSSVGVDAIDRAYAHAWLVARQVQGDEVATPDSLQAGAATLVIAYDRHGLLGLFVPEQKPMEAKSEPKKQKPKPEDDFDAPPHISDEDDLPF